MCTMAFGRYKGLKWGIIYLGDYMKKLGVVVVLILLLAACVPTGNKQAENLPSDVNVSEDIRLSEASPLDISSGPICPAYTPQGEVTYSSQWTGEYPEIETYNKAYKTATFGMG